MDDKDSLKPQPETRYSGGELADELLRSQEAAEAPKPHEYKYLQQDGAPRSGSGSSEELRARYILDTDKLIGRVMEQVDPNAEVGQDGLRDTGTTMVFLDKSARPVSWMVDELWDLYAPGYRRPDIKFANIDKEQWQDKVGRIDPDEGTHDIDVTRLDPSVFEQLRATYRDPDPEHPERSVFTGRHVQIVDETLTTGTTLEIAEQMFRQAFPDALDVDGYHWMVRPRGDSKTSEVPVWYNEDVPYGRGVGDRDVAKSLESENERVRAGAMFLSTPLGERDLMAAGIRQEIKWMREDMLNGTQRFSMLQDDDQVAPELLKAVTPWREIQREINARRR